MFLRFCWNLETLEGMQASLVATMCEPDGKKERKKERNKENSKSVWWAQTRLDTLAHSLQLSADFAVIWLSLSASSSLRLVSAVFWQDGCWGATAASWRSQIKDRILKKQIETWEWW